MSTNPTQYAQIKFIREDMPNSFVPNVLDSKIIQATQKNYFAGRKFYDADWWANPSTWLGMFILAVGTFLAFRLSWNCSLSYNTLERVVFASTAGFFNWIYVVLHFLFQSTACKALNNSI